MAGGWEVPDRGAWRGNKQQWQQQSSHSSRRSHSFRVREKTQKYTKDLRFIRFSRVRVISTHLPEDQAELFLRVGETILVLEDFSDGWMAGKMWIILGEIKCLFFSSETSSHLKRSYSTSYFSLSQAWRRARIEWAFSQHAVSSRFDLEVQLFFEKDIWRGAREMDCQILFSGGGGFLILESQ